MSLEEGTLIELIEKFPHVWDKKNPSYKDKIAVENSWKTISQIMALTVEECQEMWKSLRLKFIRERRLLKNIPSGSGAYSCRWPLFEKMGFLDSVITPRKTKGNILKKMEPSPTTSSQVWEDITIISENVSDDSREAENCSQEDDTVLETQGEMEIEMPTEMHGMKKGTALFNITNEVQNLRKEKQGKKRKSDAPLDQLLIETCTSVGQSLNSFLKSPPAESSIGRDDYYFGMSLAESLSKMKNEKKKLALKAEILEMMSQVVE